MKRETQTSGQLASTERQAALRRLTPEARVAQLRGTTLEREFVVDRASVDEKARTAWLSIASEAPYARWWGVEILSITQDAIRDERLRNGAPLLVGHDTRQQIGVVESFEITAGKKLRILARFGRSPLAEEIFRDVLDGIRRNTSVGYVIHDLVLEKQEGDVATYRVTDWEPLEGSIVAVPADHTVGVGRSAEPHRKRTTMDQNNLPSATELERQRIAAILAAGREFRNEALAQDLVLDPAATVETFKARLLEKQRGAQAQLGHGADVRMPYGHGGRVIYSPGKHNAFRDLPVEGGGVMKAEEAAYRSGQWLAAVIGGNTRAQRWCQEHGVPLLWRDENGQEVQFRQPSGALMRSQNENVLSAGGALVPVEMEAAVINLRDQYGAARKLARVRGMGSDTLKIPRRKSGLSAYFFQDDDGTGITESQKGWDNVTLSTKKLGAYVKISRDLQEDAVISVVDDLANEMAYAFAVKEDQCFINGDGTSTYGGMRGMINIFEASALVSRIAATAGHDLFSELDNIDIVSMMAGLAQYADTSNAKFLCSHFAKQMVFNRLKAIAGGNRVDILGMSPDNTFLGYEIVTSEAMPKVATTLNAKVMLFFGRFDLAASFGNRRGIEVIPQMETLAHQGQIGLVATERFDIVVHDVGTTSTSDVNGGKGPISAMYGN